MNRSLHGRLSGWIAAVTIITGIAAGACSFYLAFNEARELQDGQLRQVALLIDQFDDVVREWGGSKTGDDTEHDARLVVIPLGGSGGSVAQGDSGISLHLPPNLPEGFQTQDSSGTEWRLYVHTLSTGQRIAVGQRTAVRDEQALDSSEYTLIPILILLPTLMVLIAWIIKRTLSPVMNLSAQLDNRDDTNLAPLSDSGLPSEIEPFVISLNGLMNRLGKAIEQQRRFIADAAHELRSPLTALTVQAANLRNTALSPEGEERVMALESGLSRIRTLLEQLLNMARHQISSSNHSEVDLTRLIRQVIEDVMPDASNKGIDLGCGRLENVRLNASNGELDVLIRNAVDNAVRYTPAGGVVDVSLYRDGDRVVFQVEDNGPGIPSGAENRVFEPFYRVVGSGQTGSGLGLAMVRDIADRLGGTATLENRENGSGAVFRYTQRVPPENPARQA